MSRTVLLDSTPLGLLSNPAHRPAVMTCKAWAASLAAAGHRIIVPEIADYEVRRELTRLGRTRSLKLLDQLAVTFGYLSLNTAVMKLAAQLWAVARRQGRPTAPDWALDCDVILAAQAITLNDPAVVIATGNLGHLARFAPAQDWPTITP